MNMQPQMQGGMPPLQQQMGSQPQPGNPQQVQQMQQQLPQSHEKFDNISKVKSLIGPLREALTASIKTAAQTLHQNHWVDAGSLKGVDNAVVPRFDKHMEEFFSICDQIELHLKTSIECLTQMSSSHRYLPVLVAPTRTDPLPPSQEGTLTYPQYLATVRAQVNYAKEVHEMLLQAVQNLGAGE